MEDIISQVSGITVKAVLTVVSAVLGSVAVFIAKKISDLLKIKIENEKEQRIREFVENVVFSIEEEMNGIIKEIGIRVASEGVASVKKYLEKRAQSSVVARILLEKLKAEGISLNSEKDKQKLEEAIQKLKSEVKREAAQEKLSIVELPIKVINDLIHSALARIKGL